MKINHIALIQKVRAAAIYAHDIDCNHWYDKTLNLRYSYHLQLSVDCIMMHSAMFKTEEDFVNAICAMYLHDAQEDARLTYNDIVRISNIKVAEIVRKLTNFTRGRNRDERAPNAYYEELTSCYISTACKYADRYSHVFHALQEINKHKNDRHKRAISFSRNKMLNKYISEDEKFFEKLQNADCKEIIESLTTLMQVAKDCKTELAKPEFLYK